MPTQVLPIADLAKAGLIMDLPSVSLPPNVFSDCRNVRFRDGAIRKLEGEEGILLNFREANRLIFTCYWPHPSLAPDNGYIVIVARPLDETVLSDAIYIYDTRSLVSGTRAQWAHRHQVMEDRTDDTFWQHTLFGGGNSLILNNRTSKPIYITDVNQGFFDLPGWDSYLVDEQVTSFFYDTAFLTDEGTDLGAFVNLPNSTADPNDPTQNGALPVGVETLGDQNILVNVIPADTRISPFSIRVNDYAEPTVYANGVEFWDATTTYVNGSIVLYDDNGLITQYTATTPTLSLIHI